MFLQKGYQGYLNSLGEYDPKTKELGELITHVIILNLALIITLDLRANHSWTVATVRSA